MIVPEELLKILICPETHQPLKLADQALVDSLNQQIGRRELHDRSGNIVEEPIDGGLVREDGEVLYMVQEGIPILLVAASIALHE